MRKLQKKLEHLHWKIGTFCKNCLTAFILTAFLASFIVASSFGFWLQVKIAELLFG